MFALLLAAPLAGGSTSAIISLCTDVVGNCSLSSVDNPPCEPGNLSTCDCLVVNGSAPGGLAESAIDRWNSWERTQAWIQLVTSLTSLALSLSFMLTFAIWPGQMLRYVRQNMPATRHRARESLTGCRALAAAHARLLELLLQPPRLAPVRHRRLDAPQLCVHPGRCVDPHLDPELPLRLRPRPPGLRVQLGPALAHAAGRTLTRTTHPHPHHPPSHHPPSPPSPALTPTTYPHPHHPPLTLTTHH